MPAFSDICLCDGAELLVSGTVGEGTMLQAVKRLSISKALEVMPGIKNSIDFIDRSDVQSGEPYGTKWKWQRLCHHKEQQWKSAGGQDFTMEEDWWKSTWLYNWGAQLGKGLLRFFNGA